MELAVFWVLASIVVGVIAKSRGRVGFAWFVLALVITPLLAGILVLALKPDGSHLAAAVPAGGLAETVTDKTHGRCPDCRELVRLDARKCKHCGSALVPKVPAA